MSEAESVQRVVRVLVVGMRERGRFAAWTQSVQYSYFKKPEEKRNWRLDAVEAPTAAEAIERLASREPFDLVFLTESVSLDDGIAIAETCAQYEESPDALINYPNHTGLESEFRRREIGTTLGSTFIVDAVKRRLDRLVEKKQSSS